MRFEALPLPTQGEVERLLRVVRHRVLCLWRKEGPTPRKGPRTRSRPGRRKRSSSGCAGRRGTSVPLLESSPGVRIPGGILPVRQHVFGGTVDNNDTSSELYDPYNNQWLAGPSLPISGPYVSATMLYSGEVLALNGSGQGALYEPSTNAWRLAAPTQVHGDSVAVLLQTGEVLAIGDSSVERLTR